MKDLKFEQKRSLSRIEAADQLTALAEALRKGGEAELQFGSGTLSLRIPDDVRSEVEFEVSDGEIELEIEFTWPTRRLRKASASVSAPAAADAEKPARSRKAVPAKRSRSGAAGGTQTKRTAAKKA
ncbi:amphi-Trp domain-containing protein [Streptomyces sp. Je 1-79]|uniref:amphi-Trp domain-containing protein n=1 Tax=Streptomyces sp. Je 1-79 TaxID=2943847 RepID=UPI0021A345B8|nr:amphi-Trp domain-containing protein [Streptomyces sp. Je 1-79]MCT4352675.1 amphi-Trp domain-containing protein [Streptomyces sp. Je 1-79]